MRRRATLDRMTVIVVLLFGVFTYVGYHVGRVRQLTLDTPRMRTLCEEVYRFVDGECDPHTARLFRDHLTRCEACRREVKIETRQAAITDGEKP